MVCRHIAGRWDGPSSFPKRKAKSVSGVVRGEAGGVGEMFGLVAAALGNLAVFIAEVETLCVFVADRRGRRGKEAEHNSRGDQPGSNH